MDPRKEPGWKEFNPMVPKVPKGFQGSLNLTPKTQRLVPGKIPGSSRPFRF